MIDDDLEVEAEPEPEPEAARPVPPRGIMVPLPMPFDEEGEIDRSALAQLVDFYLRARVHALFAFGSVGQGPAMRADQRRTAAEQIMDRVGGEIPVVIHAGTADLQTTLQIARHAAALRPAGIAISPPYYYSDHTPYEISAHFAAVAEAVETPLYIYDNPRYAGIGMSPAASARLAKALPSITGLIAEHAGLDLLLQYLRTLPPTLAVFTGSIECLLPAVPYGLAGVVSGPTSPFPELCVSLWDAMVQARYDEASERQRRLNEIAALLERHAATTGRTVYRDMLRTRGVNIQRYPRWPSSELDEDVRRELDEKLEALGAFAADREMEPESLAIEEAEEGKPEGGEELSPEPVAEAVQTSDESEGGQRPPP